jgi:GrpB-like predicted nucleotidyltransferase (UPF0157 family)
MARKMMTKNEKRKITAFPTYKTGPDGQQKEVIIKRQIKTSPFASTAWMERKKAIEARVKRKVQKEWDRKADKYMKQITKN